jgi:hypothetical protein
VWGFSFTKGDLSMGKRSQAVKRASESKEPGVRDITVSAFLKWLAGMVAEKLIAREAAKQPPKKQK